jgi:hypothetical protein
MNNEPKWWRTPLMDFVDDFRYYKDPDMIAEPFELFQTGQDALFASVIETLCDELSIPIPDWLLNIPASSEPYFPSGLETLKAITLVETPAHFRSRKVFVSDNFLFRV